MHTCTQETQEPPTQISQNEDQNQVYMSMYVYVYVYFCGCMYQSIYICMYKVNKFTCIHKAQYTEIRSSMSEYVYIYIYTYLYRYTDAETLGKRTAYVCYVSIHAPYIQMYMHRKEK
jgi:hypothetical protein